MIFKEFGTNQVSPMAARHLVDSKHVDNVKNPKVELRT